MTKRTNTEWLELLSGEPDETALLELRELLIRGLRYTLSSRLNTNLDAIIEDFVQESLLKILDKLDTFRGESQFTTWAQKIAVRVALTELRRRRWRDTSLDEMLGDLREDMSKQGVKTTQKGICAGCDKPIVGQVITALGKTWHPGVSFILFSSLYFFSLSIPNRKLIG